MTDADQNPNALWWCWTENEPSTFHCRERHHDVRPYRMPVVELSTSARLRETQGALAASQADLTRVERERDEARAAVADVESHRILTARQRDQAERERDEALVKRDQMVENGEGWMRECRLARAELASARQELETLRSQLAATVQFASAYQEDERGWQVARRAVAPCALCSRPIVRGEGFQPLADAKGYFAHCFCPDAAQES